MIPIVIVGVADPIGAGLIASLSHPGAQCTGASSIATQIVGKQFELIKEIVPNDSRFAALWNPTIGITLSSRSQQLGALTMRHAVPTIYQLRAFAAAGGLMSY